MDAWGTGSDYARDETSSHVESEDAILLTYEPNQQVSISFDVKEFSVSDENRVDPFGTEFEIYIDAPMLELADNLGNYAGKISKDANKKGRFIYSVAADGQYSVSLRSEYEFEWDDAIELDYKASYSAYEYQTTLEDFFIASQNGTSIVLTKTERATNP